MNTRSIVLCAALLAPLNAYAGTCETNLMPAFTATQAGEVCDAFSAGVVGVLGNADWAVGRNVGDTANINVWQVSTADDTVINSSASDDLVLQLEDDASRLVFFDAASDAALRMAFGDGGTTATQIFLLSASTSDTDDDSTIRIAGGGAFGTDGTRGATIVVPGEEVSGGADITYNAGAGDTHIFSVAGTEEATISDDALTVSGATFSVIPGATAFAFKNNANNATNMSIADAGAITIRDTLVSAGTGTFGWAVVAGANTACTTTCTAPCVFGVNTAATEADIVGCADATADECLCAGAS